MWQWMGMSTTFEWFCSWWHQRYIVAVECIRIQEGVNNSFQSNCRPPLTYRWMYERRGIAAVRSNITIMQHIWNFCLPLHARNVSNSVVLVIIIFIASRMPGAHSHIVKCSAECTHIQLCQDLFIDCCKARLIWYAVRRTAYARSFDVRSFFYFSFLFFIWNGKGAEIGCAHDFPTKQQLHCVVLRLETHRFTKFQINKIPFCTEHHFIKVSYRTAQLEKCSVNARRALCHHEFSVVYVLGIRD